MLFGTLYAVAAVRVLPQLAFLGCLVVLFTLMTALWIRTEARHRGLDGRASRGADRARPGDRRSSRPPPSCWRPLFWLAEQLPPEVGLHGARGGVMALVLIALMLVFLVNVAGALVAAGRASPRPARSATRALTTRTIQEGIAMGKVGRFITDPKAGAYCQVTLDSGDKLVVNHAKGGFKGGPAHDRDDQVVGRRSAHRQHRSRQCGGEGGPGEADRRAPGGAACWPRRSGPSRSSSRTAASVDDVKAKCEALLRG